MVTLSSCTEKSYTISFDSQGGSNIEPFSTSLENQSMLPIPVKERYTFIGSSITIDVDIIIDLNALEKNSIYYKPYEYL